MPVDCEMAIRKSAPAAADSPAAASSEDCCTPPLLAFALDSASQSAVSPAAGNDLTFRLRGFASKAQQGVARTASGSQFWFVNGRPVELKGFTKVRVGWAAGLTALLRVLVRPSTTRGGSTRCSTSPRSYWTCSCPRAVST
jgi:hypothetical protein